MKIRKENKEKTKSTSCDLDNCSHISLHCQRKEKKNQKKNQKKRNIK